MICGRNERLGFPIWLPLLLGTALFWAGHLLAAEKHRGIRPPHVVSKKLIAV
jgi:hypothetical protein